MKKIGLITYHAAYNFGSTLQAYATQSALKDCGYDVEIINYRMDAQKDAYSHVRKKCGNKAFIIDGLQLLYLRKKILRAKRFEDFFLRYLIMTNEFSNPSLFEIFAKKYEMIISGSDQIWNKRSNELYASDWKYMNPYLLNGYTGKKISYASSLANASEDDLNKIKRDINNFSFISMREQHAAERIEALLKRKIYTVCDPIFLLDKDEWCKKLNIKKTNHQPYVFFYALASFKILNRAYPLLEYFTKQGYNILFVTPYWQYIKKNEKFINCLEFGPLEFVNTIYNADYVITDSYHGTAFSCLFNKNFYSINGINISDNRKVELLYNFNLTNRNITWDAKFNELSLEPINYVRVNSKVDDIRKSSIDYLINAIEN